MITTITKSQVFDLIESRNREDLEKLLEKWLPEELIEICAELDIEEMGFLFNSMDREQSCLTFEGLEFDSQELLMDELRPRQLQLILNDMSADNRTALLEQLDEERLNKLLKLLTQNERRVALSLLGYPEDSIGRLMTPEYIAVHKEWSIQHVLDYIRSNGEKSETLDVIYIVDEKGYLIDDIRVGEILLADTNTKVGELLDGKFIALIVTDDEESAINAFSGSNRVALPVTNHGGLLLGIITVDDILALAKKEDTEDIQKLGAVEAFKEPYMDVSVWEMFRKRAPWLVVLFIGELFTATAMGFFEHEIAKAVVLSLFIPLIVSSGGNSGSQAATLIIRAIALGEVTLLDWWRVMRRELQAGLLLGIALGILGFVRILGWQLATNVYGDHWMILGFTIGLSVIGVVLWGTLMGAMLPLILKKLGADPATSSAPFIATLVDVTGLMIYFTIAAFLLHGTLL